MLIFSSTHLLNLVVLCLIGQSPHHIFILLTFLHNMFTFLAVTKWQKMCEIKCCAVLPVVGDWEAGLTGLDLGRRRRREEGGHCWK